MSTDANPTFDESCDKFQQFLASNGWPKEIVWLRPDDLITTDRRLFYIKSPVPPANIQHYQSQFEIGITRRLGVLIEAICESGKKTFCYVWIPANDMESQNHLMPTGPDPVKMGIPVFSEDTRFAVKEIRNRLRWKYLQTRYKNHQTLKGNLFLLAPDDQTATPTSL